ncbi:F-box/kelch-repeat protein At3g06240-like [Papaver somniferum]|uniref:F-box/kelch-repeat protein At3g06240-like n=1 Tax=Papaver somniferum TaxID=3469 RepID=UPI000E705F66|nr:F-box/kelch-repeat protein At3g06240-like [Papaver somniferum]
MGTNTWKEIEDIPYRFHQIMGFGVYFHGRPHWVLGKWRCRSSESVVSLDIGDERFEELQLPIQCMEDRRRCMSVGVLDDHLSLLVTVDNRRWEMWVMEEYGNCESWTKRYDITDSAISGNYKESDVCGFQRMKPSASNLEIGNYFESFVSLNSETYRGRSKRGTKVNLEVEKKKRRRRSSMCGIVITRASTL